MRKNYKIDYDQQVNCFERIQDVKSDLIWGDPEYIADPFISYVVPVYKRADLLEKTLQSVMGQRSVEFSWNIVVVDNEAGGENDTEKLIRKLNCPRILYYRNRENIGVDGNYNRCIELANGEWVAMVHGDDLIMSDHLEKSAQYIYEILGKKRNKRLAYICQRYIDFSDEEEVILERPATIDHSVKNNVLLLHMHSDGHPELHPQEIGIFIGFYGAIPSFGTIMNRDILIREGGFNEDLGICEDIITPFKLAKKYDVYMAPVVMGYHRFDGNESVKISTILKIYSSMVDFREYMFSVKWWGKIWGNLARDIFNNNLRNYCIGQTRFSPHRLIGKDFDEIYKVKRVSDVKQFIFNFVIKIVNKRYGLEDYKAEINWWVESCYNQINHAVEQGEPILIYGAGAAAKELIPILRERFDSIKLAGVAVSDMGGINRSKLYGLNIRSIDDYADQRAKMTVITATVTWQYQDEMASTLNNKGFSKIIKLL